MHAKALKLNLCVAAVTVLVPPCFGQIATNSGSSVSGPNGTQAEETLQEVVVTATSSARSAMSTPAAVNQINQAELQDLTSSSQADILTVIPGIKAEGGGGEVATNILPRGLPATGQYQFTPLEYNGIPAFSSNGLNSTALDAYERNDLGIERLEYVNGGVSNLFGAGSVAGLFNYIDATGGPVPTGTIQTEVSDHSRFREDVAVRGPIGENDFFALSGYYRYDEGPLYSGIPTVVGQLRGNWRHDLPDDGGSITMYAQYIDDRVHFYADMPLSINDQTHLTGDDGRMVYTTDTSEAQGLTSVTPNGRFQSHIQNGVYASGGMFAVALDRNLQPGWKLKVKTKYASYYTEFNWTPGGDGVANAPESQQDFLDDAGRGTYGACGCSLALPGETLIAGKNAFFTFADNGQPVPANYLVYGNEAVTRVRPAKDFTFEASVAHEYAIRSMHNVLTLGVYGARATAGDMDFGQDYLGDFANNPRLIDVTVDDPNGVTRTVSYNGLLSNVFYRNWWQAAIHEAFYLANQMDSGPWNLDYGLRVERYRGNAQRENTSTYDLTNGPTPSATQVDNPLLDQVPWGNGSWQYGSVSTTAWAAAIAGSYRLTSHARLYANFNRGYYFPELRDIGFNPVTGQLESYQPEIIRQVEIGTKFSVGSLSGTLAAFGNDLKNRRSVNTDLFGNEVVTRQANQSVGGYLQAQYALMGHLFLNVDITYQKQKVTETSDPIGTPVGSETPQEPDTLANVGLKYDDGRFDGWVLYSYDSRAWADTQNTVPLRAWDVVRVGGGYTLPLRGSQSFRVSFDVYNLLNGQGVTEGSLHIASVTQGSYFIGRTIFPRRVTVRVAYDF